MYQEKQCREASISLHFGRKDTFWSDRMSEAPGIPPLCGQAIGLSRYHAAVGRESGSADTGYKLAQKVSFAVSGNLHT